jgi:hypothetical protein
MIEPSLLRSGWIHVKEYALAVMAAGLMYAGTGQILSVLKSVLGNYIVRFINLLIKQEFPDHMLLGEFGTIPWPFQAKMAAVGVIVIILGIFVGLWAHTRNRSRLERNLGM